MRTLGRTGGRLWSGAAGKAALLGDSTGRVSAWDTATWQLAQSTPVHAGEVLSIAPLPDGRWVSGGADKTVMLVGFADAVGTFPTNLKLAERRAAAVHRALTGAGGRASTARIVTRAFGELAPVACNDGYEARQLNRRVEVWVRD